MGDGEKTHLKLNFNPKVRLEFRGATITSDAGLLACRELDDALGLTETGEDYLKEGRTGKNILHHLIPLLRQSVYSRLAGYEDTNDAERLAQDPAMRVVVGRKGSDGQAASTSEMGRFETELLTEKDDVGSIRGLVMPINLAVGGIGAPLAGYVRDATGSYDSIWWVGVSLMVAVTALLAMTPPPRAHLKTSLG